MRLTVIGTTWQVIFVEGPLPLVPIDLFVSPDAGIFFLGGTVEAVDATGVIPVEYAIRASQTTSSSAVQCLRSSTTQDHLHYTGSPQQKHDHQHDQPDGQGANEERNRRQHESDVGEV